MLIERLPELWQIKLKIYRYNKVNKQKTIKRISTKLNRRDSLLIGTSHDRRKIFLSLFQSSELELKTDKIINSLRRNKKIPSKPSKTISTCMYVAIKNPILLLNR